MKQHPSANHPSMTTKEIVELARSIDYKAIIQEEEHNTGIDPCDLLLPAGWANLFDLFFTKLRILGGRVIRLYYLKDVMRVDILNEEDLPTKWLSQGMMKHSASTCLVCGKSALRRKAYEGWPPLCSTHIIEYANQLEE